MAAMRLPRIAATRHARRRRLVAAAALLLALLAFLRAGPMLVVSHPLAAPDAIVSLASHEWERLPAVTKAAADYPTATIFLTVPSQVTVHTCHRCGERAGELVAAGIRSDRIQIVPLQAPGTYGEALGTLEAARRAGVRQLLIVTSPYHTRRSLAVFRSVFSGSGIDIGVRPASASSPAAPGWWWLHGYDWAYVAYEWAATIHYAIKYGVSPL
jgi:uncharacterized SAM-binding protein YcdF (DUF218 family)